MSRLYFMYTLCALVVFCAGAATAFTNGSLVTHSFQSVAERRTYIVNVYYPPGFNCSNWKYPLIYLLHGHSGNETDWVDPQKGNILPTANALFNSGTVQPAVLVFPGDQFSWWIDSLVYRKAQTAFFEELIPYIETDLLAGRVMTTKAGRMIGGLSAGGYAAIRYSMLFPEYWASAAPLSPAIYSPDPTPTSSALGAQSPFRGYDNHFNSTFWQSLNYPMYWEQYIGRGWDDLIPMYLNSGDYDRFRIAYHVSLFFNELWNRQANITKLVVQLRIVSGDHDWPVWRSTIGDAMSFMLHYAAQPVSLGAAMEGYGPGCINPVGGGTSAAVAATPVWQMVAVILAVAVSAVGLGSQ